MKKCFGIDIDGTVTRPDSMVPFLNKAFQLNLAYEDITEYELTPFVNISSEVFAEWFVKNEPAIYSGSKMADGAKQALAKWATLAELYFISARRNDLMEITETWFNRHELCYHHIELIGSHDKIDAAKRFGVDIFFEDKHDNAVAIATECGIPVILFDTPYNRKPVPEQVIRVNDWAEAEKWVENWLKG
ncbi:hypothetical protein [Bacillus sp. V5-8f]|uniref:5' nucleotidase, NT5C type n=1 Tax=Bacillus sp. V5-8f TaxID=2053044 RepID=UPI000C791014|nr:hypothetical protein [Bacillus sp. V5-8f]PLT34688.1 hypothetical protein CUU64_04570 [Bacillus sp. V5-8f]